MKKTIIFIILFFSSLAQGQFWENPNQKPSMFGMRINRGHLLGDPVGLWLMSERFGNKVFDLSGNGHTGTFIGDLSWVSGKSGPAIASADEVGNRIGTDITNTNYGQKATIITSIKFDLAQTVVGTGRDTIFGSRYYTDNEFNFQQHSAVNYRIFFTVGSAKYAWWVIPGGNTTDYFTLALVYDSTQAADADKVKLYSNSLEVTQSDFAGITTEDLQCSTREIGILGNTINDSFQGRMRYLYFYNRALTASEIALLYREPFCFMEPNWDMELYGWMTAPAVGAGQFININMN